MEPLNRAVKQARTRMVLLVLGFQLVVLLGSYTLWEFDIFSEPVLAVITIAGVSAAALVAAIVIARYINQLLRAFGDAILHVSPSGQGPAPDTDKLAIGKEYVSELVYKLYEMASMQDNKLLAEHRREATQASNILTRLPLPIFVFNKQQIITFASETAINYCGISSAELFGKPLFDAVDLEFPNEFTLESWIRDCQKNKVSDTAYWRRVRLKLKDEDGALRQCDMAGYYNRDNPSGIEFIITLFDRTQEYAQDDESLSFTALAVHELRNPLTVMRGYIEVFEEELYGKLDGDMIKMMYRMRAAAQQLSTFVNNILNVAKIEESQLTMKLAEEKWEDILSHAADDMDLAANAQEKKITYSMPAKLPTVGVDRVSIYEVLCNLIDNALKYSGKSKEIHVTTILNKEGLVETRVEDKGVGIPESVLPSLFEKFHRNHRNRAQISGTGLGLYLSKSIVDAHGGNIWVESKEGQGTTVSFTVKPYSMLADELKNGNNKDDLVRTAHGWIKNHSLYRR